VRDRVRDRLDFTFDDLGEQSVKNIARPVRVYRVRDRAVPIERPLPAAPQPLPLPDKPSIPSSGRRRVPSRCRCRRNGQLSVFMLAARAHANTSDCQEAMVVCWPRLSCSL
jgi:hypothetical protein